MAPTFKAVDLQDDGIARLAFNVDLRPRTGRTARPTLARFEAWLLVGRRTREVHLVGCLAAKRLMWTMFVIPIADQADLPLKMRLIFRNSGQPENLRVQHVAFLDEELPTCQHATAK